MIDVNDIRDREIALHDLSSADAAYTIYHDETNNIRKFLLTDDGTNVAEHKNFVLGGIALQEGQALPEIAPKLAKYKHGGGAALSPGGALEVEVRVTLTHDGALVGAAVAGALGRVDLSGALVITHDPQRVGVPATRYADVLATPVTPAVAASIARLRPDDLAALMLTSGSTDMPKVVPITFDALMAKSVKIEQLPDSVAVILEKPAGSRTGAYLQVT